MFDRTGQTVRLREGAVPTLFYVNKKCRPRGNSGGTVMKTESTISPVAVHSPISDVTHSSYEGGQLQQQQEVKQKLKEKICGVKQPQPSAPMNFLTISNVMFTDPNTKSIMIAQVPSVLRLQQPLDSLDTAAVVSESTAPVMPVETQTAYVDHNYSSCSSTASVGSSDSDNDPNASSAENRDSMTGSPPGTRSAGLQNTVVDHSYSTSSDSARGDDVNLTLDDNIPSTVDSISPGEELPAFVEILQSPDIDHLNATGCFSHTSNDDHRYVLRDSRPVLKAKLERSYVRNLAQRRKMKVLQQKVRRLQARVNVLKDALQAARKNSANPERVLMPKQTNTQEDRL